MKFQMKGINTLINSPLTQVSSTGQETIINTNFTENLAGENIAIGRTISQQGSTDGGTDVGYEESFNKLNDEQRKDYPDLASWESYVKDYNANKNATEIDQVRDYTQGLITKPGEAYKNKFYKQGNGKTDEAFQTGTFLAGLITKGGGEGDENTYITSNEAMELYKQYNKQIVRDGNKVTDPNKKTWALNWNNWRKQRELRNARLSYQKGYTPTEYSNNENLGGWKNVKN